MRGRVQAEAGNAYARVFWEFSLQASPEACDLLPLAFLEELPDCSLPPTWPWATRDLGSSTVMLGKAHPFSQLPGLSKGAATTWKIPGTAEKQGPYWCPGKLRPPPAPTPPLPYSLCDLPFTLDLSPAPAQWAQRGSEAPFPLSQLSRRRSMLVWPARALAPRLACVRAPAEHPACREAGGDCSSTEVTSGEIKEKFAEEVTFGLALTIWLEFPFAEGVVESDGSSSPRSAQNHPLVSYLSASVALSGKWR